MSDYYGLYGQKVQYLASDPTDVQTGQVWYNSTSATLKVRSVTTSGTWAAGGNLGTARYMMGSAVQGTQTASLVFGGNPYTGVTESYNGTSWSPVSSLNTSRGRLAGAGTQTSALAFGGLSPSLTGATEKWSGSSWTNNPTGLNNARRNLSGLGTQTAALAFGGVDASDNTNKTEEYDGSTWTNSGVVPAPTAYAGTAGTQTAGLGFALASGSSPYVNNITISYNGSSWSTLPASMNTARSQTGSAGTQTAAIVFGGSPPLTGATELWNGTSWTSSTSLSTARYSLAGSGTQTAALGAGGAPPASGTAATEEWTGPGVGTTKTVTVS
jgi:hypothetical protein